MKRKICESYFKVNYMKCTTMKKVKIILKTMKEIPNVPKMNKKNEENKNRKKKHIVWCVQDYRSC